MSDDSKELSRVEDILSGEDYLPKKPMSRVEELLMNGAMVPKVDDTDNGKILKVIDGEWQPGDDVSGDNLPPVSSLDNGKVLKVVSGEWNIGDDKSESSFVYIGSTYPFSGSKVALPANINSVLIANYTSSPKVPTFLVSSNNIIFEPKEVSISTGTTPSVHIRWGRMYSTFDSATREENIYNDSLSYNTQNQTTEASYFKTKAIQTIPPVDVPDNGKVMQVSGGHWVAELLPEVDGVPQVTSSDIGKVLKATGVNTYGWEKDGSDIIVIRTLDEYPFLNDEVDLSIASINNLLTAYYNRDLGASSIPIYLMSSNGMLFEPVTNQTVIFDPDEGLSGSMTWSRIIVKTDVSTHKELLFREAITYTITDQNPTGVFTSAEIETGGTDNHAVHIPPVIFNDGKLKKIEDLTGFPGIEKVYLTAEEYALLTTAEKEDLSKVYYISQYKYFENSDGTLIVRVDGNNDVWIFFNGWTFDPDAETNLPAGAEDYATSIGNSYGYSDASSETRPVHNQPLWVRFNGTRASAEYASDYQVSSNIWYPYVAGAYTSPVYGKLKVGEQSASYTYSDPFDTGETIIIYYGNKQYTDFDIPDPLPSVTSADEGKALVVNSNGEWDKGDIREVPAIHLGDNDKILTVESGEASWSSPKKVTHLYDEIPINNPLYFLGNIDPSTSPLTIDMTQHTTNYEELRSTDFEFVFMGGESNLIKRPWGYNSIDNAPGTFSYDPVTGELTATLYGGFSSETNIGIVYKKAIIQLNENAVITGQSGTIDCTDVPNADILTVADFGIVLTNVNELHTSNTGTLQIAASMSYNQTTKQLSWSVNKTSYEHLKASGYVVVGNYGDPEYRLITNFVGASSGSDGYRGYVPSPVSADKDKFLKGDGTWNPVYRELTQQEYDALPSSKNSDGIIYFITDNS